MLTLLKQYVVNTNISCFRLLALFKERFLLTIDQVTFKLLLSFDIDITVYINRQVFINIL